MLSGNGIQRLIERRMPSFNQGDVIKVPFPYTDRATRQSRPALVVSTGDIQATHRLLWVVMITSAENRGWPGDVAVTTLAQAGLPAPSIIRTAKIATIEPSDAIKLGRIPAALLKQVTGKLGLDLGLVA
jgi:mRNA interferase MazF